MDVELKVGDTVCQIVCPRFWKARVPGIPRVITRETRTLWITDEDKDYTVRWKKNRTGLSLYDDEAKALREVYLAAEDVGRMVFELWRMDFHKIYPRTLEIADLLRKVLKLLKEGEEGCQG